MKTLRYKLILLLLSAILAQITFALTEEEIRKSQREKRDKLAKDREREWEEYVSQRRDRGKESLGLDRVDMMVCKYSLQTD